MNKFLVISYILLITLSANASCNIDNATTCSIKNYKENTISQNNISTKKNYRIPLPQKKQQQTIKHKTNFGDFTSSENNSNYNSNCQFGVCLQSQRTPNFQQPKQ